ncbi:MAG TPA: hypothetical protein VL424_11270 [Pararobbsia sp.]|jgi:hypothetical protein|nr:hypothetical protein [Pararobbsia sp.]
MQQQTQRTTVKAAAGTKPTASVAHMIVTARERDVADTTGRSRYCEPGLERLLRQAPEGISLTLGADTQEPSLKR